MARIAQLDSTRRYGSLWCIGSRAPVLPGWCDAAQSGSLAY